MLLLHRCERADVLVGGLAEVLRVPLADPFTAEVVAVPAKGVERWLAQQLAQVLGAAQGEAGVCAHVRFPSPWRLFAEVVSQLAGLAREAVDPWSAEALMWPLLEVMDACAGEPWCAALGAHLGRADGVAPAGRERRRFSVARALAGHLAAYDEARPEAVRAWAAGRDVDADGSPLPADLRWQAELWRRVRAAVGVPSPAEAIEGHCERLRDEPEAVDLPERLSVFGPTRLSAGRVAVLSALAERRDVHLWLPHPSPGLWESLQGSSSELLRRSGDASGLGVRHPLLASLGRDARELQRLLAGAAHDDEHLPPGPRPATLLGALQHDLAVDDQGASRHTLDPADRSVSVHACHGRARQVEVLREAVLGLMAADPTLEPRDVLVLCPDVEGFAPLVAASFGLGAEDDAAAHPASRLRVRLADRSLRQTNPVLAVAARLLELADARLTASEVLGLASSAAVRARFHVDDDDLERLQVWVADAGVRWGLDPEHRAEWLLGSVGQGTWRAGLDRVLLGAAMEGDGDWLGAALPLDDVDSSAVELAGRLAELVDRLEVAHASLQGPQPLSGWLDALADATLSLAAAHPDAGWQVTHLTSVLEDVRRAAGARADVSLGLADLRALLARQLEGRPTRSSFRTGALTVCSLVPMRSVPHRVICLLGLDEGVFPRRPPRAGDDLLARAPFVGERDPSSEDRQLLLDAVMSAQEHLIITWTGADERTGARRPPATPLAELLDALDATAATRDGRPVRAHALVRQPLQPFDARSFTAGALGAPGPFSFDVHALRGALAALAERRTMPAAFLAERLAAPVDGGDVQLDDLISLLENPARAFLRQRLDVTLPYDEGEPEDALPVELGSLAEWAVRERLLRARLRGLAQVDACAVERRRGALPPGALGSRALDAASDFVEGLLHAAAEWRTTEPASLDVVVPLPHGRHLVGTVGDLTGDTLLVLSASRLGAKQRLGAWVRLLALAAGRPDRTWSAVLIGKGSRDASRTRLRAPGPAEALDHLADLVALRDEGLRAPLPLPLKTGYAYAQCSGAQAGARQARHEWSGDRFPGEGAAGEHALLWPGGLPALLTGPPTERSEAVPTRFAELAHRVWGPLRAHEGAGR